MFEPEPQASFIPSLLHSILDHCLTDILTPVPPIPSFLSSLPHTYHPSINIHQGQSYQQYTDNLCGYHAIYNALCFLHSVRQGQTEYSILSGASFWRFKRRVQRFLTNLKELSGYEDEWPWRQEDILYGDYERSYNEICMYFFEEFEILRDSQHFELFSFTWQFQYGNLLMEEDQKVELQSTMGYFRDYEGEKPVIISFMLGITDHWMCFQAIKKEGVAQYWFFDSGNLQFLELDDKGIEEYVQQLDKERMELRKEGFKPFDKKNLGVCMRDTQISLRLIIDCIESRTTLESYTYNQQFKVFAVKLQRCRSELPLFQKTLDDYWLTITTFFETPLRSLLSSENRATLALISSSAELHPSSARCRAFLALLA